MEACTGSADGGTVRRGASAVAAGRCDGRCGRPSSARPAGRTSGRHVQSSVPCRAARPAAPRLRSSALGTRPPRAARPVSGTRPGRAPCHAARVLLDEGAEGMAEGVAARRLDQIWPLEIGPTSWRSARGTFRRTAVPAVRAPGRGARGPYAGTSPRSSWARPAALLGPGGLPTVRGGAPGRARAGPAEVVRVVPTENLAPGGGARWGAGVHEPVAGAGWGRAGGRRARGGRQPGPQPGQVPGPRPRH